MRDKAINADFFKKPNSPLTSHPRKHSLFSLLRRILAFVLQIPDCTSPLMYIKNSSKIHTELKSCFWVV